MPGTHAGRTRRLSPWPWLVPVAALVAGALFASSVRASEGQTLRSDYGRLPDLIREQTRVNADRADRVSALQAQVEQATAALAPGNQKTERIERASTQIAPEAGRTPVAGPTLKVSLDDAKLDGGELPAGADPDDYVIHQQDVQSVVNALWAGGAEAMMLQDQRVVSTSAVRCVGNTLILQGRVYSPPYVIQAIGDTARLQEALDRDPSVENLRGWSVRVGLGYGVEDVGEQTFPAYSGSISPKFAVVPESTTP
ncbi:DUF881 domain-containing protein [Phycicoccus flavus]|uniref:DUF881 domain-containing protein n=1 Tax=Phycicoccus flavus TaxID=2502783 RepID=UPI000FEB82C5|nr:DUF881 domain-containing protein [Phycicoccus flavus]NHA69352.1 DUF881 domain-containing protein [Phycicoccus flavus]